MKGLILLAIVPLVLSLGLIPAPVAETTESNSGNWTRMASNTEKSLSAVWGSSSTDVFAVGQDGTILHYDGFAWTAMDSGFSYGLYGVWGSSSTDVYAVGYAGNIIHYDGTEWAIVVDNVMNHHFNDIWGSCASDVFAVGGGFSHGTILHYNGIRWTVMPSDDAPWLYGVWGTGSDVYSVGKGKVMRLGPFGWSVLAYVGGTSFLYDIWAGSSSAIFVVGQYGGIQHYDGSSWRSMSSGVDTSLRSVWGSLPDDVYVVGDDGYILHYDGVAWTAMNSGTSSRLNGIWGSSPTDVFAVGYGGTILHYGGGPAVAEVVGQTREVNCAIVAGANLTLYQGDVEVASTVGDAEWSYALAVPEFGEYQVVASKVGFRDDTQSITVDSPATYVVDFVRDHGLIPNAPNMSYVLDCINLWQFGEPQCKLTMPTVLAVINAWQFPVLADG